MGRPPHDPADPKGVDETTDAWDTVDWLVKNVPNNNGRVGIAGTSYDGWTAVMAALDPHPALKAVIEQASPADMFLGDDFHHNGAFRLSYGFEYAAMLETAPRRTTASSSTATTPTTGTWGSVRSRTPTSATSTASSRPGRTSSHHPELRRVLAAAGVRSVPERGEGADRARGRLVGPGGLLRPAEDLRELEPHDTEHRNYLVVGPWNHGGVERHGRRLGAIDFGSDTSQYYREHIFQPWFDYWLRGQSRPAPGRGDHLRDRHQRVEAVRRVAAETRSRDAAPVLPRRPPPVLRRACARRAASTSMSAIPANPVPYRPRPVPPTYPGPEWKVWLVQDQRFVDHRPDVLSWETEPLAADVRVAGDIVADLFASTSGTDSDWVVKLIDVYPEDAPDDAETKTKMGGFQLIIADEILRARFRNGFEKPEAVPAGQVVRYAIDLHTNAHAFLKGHRIMVQVQSTWFPVYDRNPQKFVPNIFEAHAEDYVKATQRIYRAAAAASAIVLPVVK